MSDICQEEMNAEILRFELVVYISLGLTFSLYLITVCMKDALLANPGPASKVFYGFGVVKILIGIILFAFLTPTCPQNCFCPNYHPTYFYPIIVIVIGGIWIRRGYKLSTLQAAGGSSAASASAIEAIPVSSKGDDIV